MNRSGNQASTTSPASPSRSVSTSHPHSLPAGATPASQSSDWTFHVLGRRDTELHNLEEQIPVALHHLDREGTIIWANQAELTLLGYDRAEYVGQPISAVHVDQLVCDQLLERLRRGETVRDQAARLWCRDGSIRQVSISSIDTGSPDRFCCMMIDVTGQQIATETTARLAAIVDSSNDAIVGKLLDGTVTSWNQAAERMFGWRAEEMIGNSIARIVPPERRDELKSILARLARGERIAHHETIRMRADGTRIEISVSISPIYDDHGNIIGVAKIARDISERRAAERRRQELLEVVAHDLRTPLTTVLGYAQLLQRRLGDDVALKAIATQASRMGRLLADVLETARMESGHQYLRCAPFDLGELVRESALNSTTLTGKAGIRVTLPEEPVIGVWDIDRIAQILVNLLDNASKYAPDSEIEIEVSRVGDEAWLSVRDHGPGIPLAHRSHIFERFYQAGSGHQAATGVGLGLFISRALAEVHGGRLWVDSEPGEGSVSTLALPLPNEAPVTASSNGAVHSEPAISSPGVAAAR